MITAGIDVGIEFTKAVIMKDGAVIGKAQELSGGAKRPDTVDEVYKAALKNANVSADDVQKIISTGKGKFDVPFANDNLAEVLTAAKAAKLITPEATTVISVGADEIVVATLDDNKIDEFVINQKCAAGLGLFLEWIADRLDMSLDELSALEGPPSTQVNDGCIVFAELDALSLLNRGEDPKEVAKAVIEACAWRTSTTINDIYKARNSCIVMIGGLARNGAFIKALERISGLNFIIADHPEYCGAVGAAALATEF